MQSLFLAWQRISVRRKGVPHSPVTRSCVSCCDWSSVVDAMMSAACFPVQCYDWPIVCVRWGHILYTPIMCLCS